MAQLFDSTATCLRVADDVIRFYGDPQKQESYCQTLTNIQPLVKNLLFKNYTMYGTTEEAKDFVNVTATRNIKRRPDPAKKDGKIQYFDFKAASKTWYKNSKGKWAWKYSTKTDIEKKSYIPDIYESFAVDALWLTGNTLHLYFTATRGMPRLYGNGDMRSGQFIYKEANTDAAPLKYCYRNDAGVGTTFYLGWEEREYKVIKKNGKYVWKDYLRQTGTTKWARTQPTYSNGKTETVKTFYKVKKDKKGNTLKDKNGNIIYQRYTSGKNKGKKIPAYRRGYKYVHKYYWSPLVLKDDGTFYCSSFNKIHKIVSYPGFKGNITNELIGTISFDDKHRLIKALRPQAFSNEGALKSGVSTFFMSDVEYCCAKCAALGHKKYTSLDSRYIKTAPTDPSTLDSWSKMDADEKTEAKKVYDTKLANYNNSCHEESHKKGGVNDKGTRISFKLYLSALDNRTKPTVNLNGHINAPVLLNVDNY